MLGLSFQELAIVGIVAILLFGKDLPATLRKFGGMYRDMRKSLDDLSPQVIEAFAHIAVHAAEFSQRSGQILAKQQDCHDPDNRELLKAESEHDRHPSQTRNGGRKIGSTSC